MGEILPLLGVLAVFFILIGLAWLVAAKLGMLKPGAKAAEPGKASAAGGGYRVRDGVLSPGERAMYPVLVEAVRMLAADRKRPVPIVLGSVRLAEVLEVDSPQGANRSAWQTAFNRVASKQVDFVVCHPETTRPLVVIELDDRSHGRADRKDRDGFVDEACRSAGLPMLHVPAAAQYDARRLAGQIGALL